MLLTHMLRVQALQATAAAEAERKANSSRARIELEEQMKERLILQQQQQVRPATPRPATCLYASRVVLLVASSPFAHTLGSFCTLMCVVGKLLLKL